MTPNKRQKTKTRAHMQATGTNYVRAARDTGAESLKDPARLSWSPGTIAGAGKTAKAVDTFQDARYPHLLISGMSAAQPEATLVDMIDQLMAANTTEDIQFQIIEPTLPLTEFKDSPYVSQYMDSWTPNADFMSNAADMMEDAVVEMNRRNARLINHHQLPKNLKKAREIAIFDAQRTGTRLDQHRLWMPYIFIVIQEAASLFADTASKDERDVQRRLVVAAAELTRKARSAGIFLVMSTNMPSAVPAVIRNSTRRIAFSTPSSAGSLITIGDESLVGLPKDRGFIVEDPDIAKQEFVRNPIK